MEWSGNGDPIALTKVDAESNPDPVRLPGLEIFAKAREKPLAALVEVGEVPVAVRVHYECAKSRPRHYPLTASTSLRVILSKPKDEYSRDCIVCGIYNSLAPRTK